MGKPVIAAFDFDGTITTADSFIDILFHVHGRRKTLLGLAKMSPALIAMKLGHMNPSTVKEMVFGHFWGGMDTDEFRQKCRRYSKARVPAILRADTLAKIHQLKARGATLVIVSASITDWIEPWARELGFSEIIGTIAESENGKITGKFAGKNCKGEEKVLRFKRLFPKRDTYTLLAYGDSDGDNELLAYADSAERFASGKWGNV